MSNKENIQPSVYPKENILRNKILSDKGAPKELTKESTLSQHNGLKNTRKHLSSLKTTSPKPALSAHSSLHSTPTHSPTHSPYLSHEEEVSTQLPEKWRYSPPPVENVMEESGHIHIRHKQVVLQLNEQEEEDKSILKERINRITQEKEQNQAELNEINQKIREIRNESNTLDQRLKDKDRVEARIRALDDEIEENKATLDELMSIVTELGEDELEKRKQHEEKEMEINELMNTLSTLNYQMATVQ
ncbi:hypothetical protein BDB01DRAFT_850388 [Pilobolus umbonatus]|nr:hypothetical protein BDB01DRAFT_850388 [Pilobolus umbonatus]